MLTGDLPIGNNNVFKEFSTYYAKYLEHFLIYQIPHHGGKLSHHPDLRLHALGVVSYGTLNRYGHPHPDSIYFYQRKLLELYSVTECNEQTFHIIW